MIDLLVRPADLRLHAARPGRGPHRRGRLRGDGRLRRAARAWRSSGMRSATPPSPASSSPTSSAPRSTSAGRSRRSRPPSRSGSSSRRGNLRFDTAVGVLFAGTFALGVLLFSTIRGYVTDLFSYLLGNVLGITEADLIQIARPRGRRPGRRARASQGAPVRDLRSGRGRRVGAAGHDASSTCSSPCSGVTIVVSIQAVGIILVVAMLTTPAATAQLLVDPVRPPDPRRGRDRGRRRRSSGCTSASISTSRPVRRSSSSRRCASRSHSLFSPRSGLTRDAPRHAGCRLIDRRGPTLAGDHRMPRPVKPNRRNMPRTR